MNDASNPFEPAAPGDRELLREVAEGSEAAFLALFQKWAPRLRAFFIRSTGTREAGEDLLQEAFLRIFRAAPGFEPRGEAGAWIYRICANLAYSFWRREGRSPLRGGMGAEAGSEPARGHAETPERVRLRAAFTDAFQDALGRLPANQRMVFLLKVEQGLTYEEIGEALRCPAGTAKSRFHHAALRLRARLGEWEGADIARLSDTLGVVRPPGLSRRTQPQGGFEIRRD